MQSESNSEIESQSEDIQIETTKDVLVCPNCGAEQNPNALYCLGCGYPLYALEQDEPGKSKQEEAEAISGTTDESKVETSIDTEMEAEVPPLIEEAGEAQEETTPREEEVEPEPGENLNIIDSVSARARDIISRYIPFKGGSMKNEIESEEKQAPSYIEDEYNYPAEVGDLTRELVKEEAAELAPGFEPDPILKGVMSNLVKSISLNLWLVNKLQEGNVDEEQFNSMLSEYVNRLELSMKCREEMLDRARDLDSTERALKAAKLGLAELEMKKSIGDISEEEYRAKSPGFKWDINKHQGEISRRKGESAFLEDLRRTMSEEEMAQMKEMADKCQMEMAGLEESGELSPETSARVKESTDKILEYLKNFDFYDKPDTSFDR
jgi:hypothetical protein